ncbi:autotransporter domain-containing protein [Bosea sp. LjRoot9]|uniref:autotransporter outer membrane beta-barrel domain-containing protein n=1 Tax=Bosea sp. LjRoot9 TaxID=3342341 RepID=UPI003ED067D6
MSAAEFNQELARARLAPRLVVAMLAAGLALPGLAPMARAQSVTGTGELSPTIPAPPLTSWDLGGVDLTIGDAGTGALTIAAGGAVSDVRYGYIAKQAGSSGALSVTGAGSSWANDLGEIYIGYGGTGTLMVADGGALTTGVFRIGNNAGSNGTATVTGAGTSLTALYQTYVGVAGTGSLTIADGATVSSGGGGGSGYMGGAATGNGTVTVTGTGSRWINIFDLGVGLAGTGVLRVENGGVVESSIGRIGTITTGNGTVTVTGAGSRWTTSSEIIIADAGTGSLIIENGGVVSSGQTSNRSGTIGYSAGGSGTVSVTGAGSSWTLSRDLAVGRQGSGGLTVSNGGTVSNRAGIIGQMAGGSGAVTVTGAGSTWTNSTTLSVGAAGSGTLTIAAGGKVSATVTTLAASAGSSGTLTLSGTSASGRGALETGQVVKGAGTATLTLDGGILRATRNEADFLSGFSALTLGAGGVVLDSNGFSLGVSTGFSGTGGLTKSGSGTLILTSANSYSGATSVADGTLYVNGSQALSAASDYTIAIGTLLDVNDGLGIVTTGSIAGAGQIRIEQDSTLETGATNASTSFTGVIYDAGALRKVGTGTLTLTGENTYSGGTTIAGGAISIDRESNLGAFTGALTLDGGVLRVTGTTLTGLIRNIVFGAAGGGFDIADAGNTFTVTQSFAGAGSFSKAGAGTLVLAGTQSYSGATTVTGGILRAGQAGSFSSASAFTVSAGATLDLAGFNQSIGSLTGAGTVTLSAAALTTGSDNSSTTFSGAISGSGGLTKTGSGTFTLSGTNSYTGTTIVTAGKLVINGSLASTVALTGGTLGGSGTIGGVTIGNGATIAPGNSIGTLSVAGNVAFATGSIYQLEINAAGQSDRIAASGTATISGGTVALVPATGTYAAATRYTILTAGGGVTGQFAAVTLNFAFLTPALSYDATSVTLTMTRNDTAFGPGTAGASFVAQTRNQGFIAVAAERLGVGTSVYDALISATVAQARAGFDLLSGEAHAQAVSVAISESALLREAILGRLRGPLLTAPGGQVAAAFSADLPGRKDAVTLPSPRFEQRYAFWGEALGGQANSDGDGNAASLSRRSGGAVLGADMLLYDTGSRSLRLGIAGGYTQSRFDLDARRSTGTLDSGHAALYAGARFGALRLDAGVAYSRSESDIRRQVAIGSFGDILRSQRPGAVTQAFAELGYTVAWPGDGVGKNLAFEPFAQLALLRVSSEATTEQGGAAALRLFSSEQTLGFSTLGLRAEAQVSATPFFARAMLGWRHGFGELTPQAVTAFAGGTTQARVFAARLDRDALAAEAGLDWRASSATTLGLTYAATLGERSRDHALKGRIDVRF